MAVVVVLLLCHLLKEGIEEVVVLSAEWSGGPAREVEGP